jgi:hypothetical protein
MAADVMLTVFDTDGNSIMLDIYEADSIKLNYQFSKITNFENTGTYSWTFRAPLTKKNAQFFGAIDNVNSILPWFDFRKKTKAVLSVDTLPIARGHIKIGKTYKRSTNNHLFSEVDIEFSGEVADLSKQLGDKKLSDLDYSDLEHTVDTTTIDSLDDVKWTLTDRGQKWSEDTAVTGTRRIFNTSAPIYPNDLTPIVNARWIWQRIFAEAGFTYEGSVLDGIINDYWIPYIAAKDIQLGNLLEEHLVVGGFEDGYSTSDGTSILPLEEIQDVGGDFASSHFIAPLSGTYTFRLSGRIKHTETGMSYTATLALNRSTTSGDTYTLPNGSLAFFGFALTDSYQDFSQDLTLNLMAGDLVYVQKFVDTALTGSVEFDRCEVLRTIAIGPVLDGFTFYGDVNAPDMKQIDFVRSIIKMHNLGFIPHPTTEKKYIVEPLASYIGSGETYDFTNKVDVNKDIVIYPTTDEQAKTSLWTYKAGGEYLSSIYTNAGRAYGQYKLENTGNDFSSSEVKVELEFRSIPCNEVANTSIPIPKFVDANGVFVLSGPRIMFIGGHADLAVYDGSGGVIVSVPIISHYSATNPTVTDYDLNFAAESPPQNITANPYGNLYNLYWRRYYEELYSKESRVMECYLKLTVSDVYRLTFADVLWIEDSYWRLLEINNYVVGSQESTLCKLARIVDTQPTCSLRPASRNGNGTINWVNAADESVAGNQTCCELYGYSWNGTTEQCYAFPQNIVRQ